LTSRPSRFPYTTLFRSKGEDLLPVAIDVVVDLVRGCFRVIVQVSPHGFLERVRLEVEAHRARVVVPADTVGDVATAFGLPVFALDRKSTRLNSSHQIIS